MKSRSGQILVRRVVLLAAVVCATGWAAGEVRGMRDRSEVAKMTAKMKAVCVGRFLVDVPAESRVSMSHEMIDGFAISTIEENEASFNQRLAKHEAEIEARGAASDTRGPGGILVIRDLHIPGMVGKTVVYGRTRTHGFEAGQRVESESVAVEVHGHKEGRSFSLSANYVDEADAKAAEALLGRLRLRGENEIPTESGFCIRRAVFAEPLPPHTTEHIAVHFSVPGHPDLAMTLASFPGGGAGSNLIARIARIDDEASADEMLRVTKLRSNRRALGGLEGEEVLERVREYNFATTYGFNWEARGEKDDLFRPHLSLELQSGISERPGAQPVDTSLHQDAVLFLWDSIASSIRRREPATKPPDASPKSPTLAAH